jgi:hypothetical protein
MAYTAPIAIVPTGSANIHPVTQFLADSTGVTSTAAAPTAGTVVATLTPAAGTYSVQVSAGLGLGGTPAAADNANMRLRVDGTNIATLPTVAAANVVVNCGTFILTVNGAQAIDVQAIGNASASTVYIAQLIATRIR